MEAAIVGEEQFTQKQICSYIRNHRPDCRMEIFATGEELLAAGKKFDLIFLDIQLRGFNGIEQIPGNTFWRLSMCQRSIIC